MFTTNILLAPFSSYKIGGRADYFCEPKTVEELITAVTEANQMKLPLFVLGGGTNLLISDEGFRGVVIKPTILGITKNGANVTAGAGVTMADLLVFTIENGLSGLEWAGGLPGTVGGAVRGNAGAFGGEIKDSISEVTSVRYGKKHEVVTRDNKECRFGYRASVFKERGDEIVVSATFALKPGDKETIRSKTEEKKQYRKDKHPLEKPNVGSIFKNVPLQNVPKENLERVNKVIKHDPFPVVPTAFLISEAGLKGTKVGAAQVSEKHPNFIVNTGSATAADVRGLIVKVKEEVKKKFGILLEEEVMYVGNHENKS